MKNIFKLLTLVSLSFFILACGSEGSSQVASSDITVSSTKSTLTSSKKVMNIDFLLTNNYSSKVTVQVKDLSLAIAPCTVESSVFTPNDFTFNQEENVKISAEVIFTEECTPSAYNLKGITVLTLDGEAREMTLDSNSKELNASILTSVGGVTETNSTVPLPTIVTPITLPTIVIPNALKIIKLSTNSKTITIPIKVFKDISPYAEGSVKVELPTKVLSGVDIGSFESYDVAVNEQGIATFKYTGPANLKALVNNNDLSSIFRFYHVEDSKNKEEVKVVYEVKEDTYVPVDYSLNITTKDDEFSMGIPDLQRTFTINLLDSEGSNVNSGDITITKIKVATENSLILQLLDNQTGEGKNSVILENQNFSTFILNSKKLSGIAPIRVTVDFIDINKKAKKLTTILNIRVMSGPPSAISISYVSTGQDTERAKYEEKFAVSVTDEYGNKVNTKPYISLGAIVGYTVDGQELSSTETNDTRRLFYGKNDVGNGIIIPGSTPSSATFEEENPSSSVFQHVNAEGANTDKLVVFGAGKNYEAMGKWDFNKIDDRTLSVQDDYFGTKRENLYYAVGHNYYQDQCREDGREWLGSTDSESYQLDDEGTVVVSYKYDYHLTGKDALVWVNLNGFQSDTAENTRIGEVVKHTLRGTGFTTVPTAGYLLDKGASTTRASFHIWHENAPERYRNGHFGWRVKTGSTCAWYVINSSNYYDARTCKNGGSSEGQAYVRFYLEAPADKGCTFDLEGLGVNKEF